MINTEGGLQILIRYLLVLLIILNSKTVYFGIIHKELTQVILIIGFILGIIFLKLSIRPMNINLIRFSLLIIFILINIMFNFRNMSPGHLYIVATFVVNIFIIFIICTQFTRLEIAYIYVNLMSVVCLISLICFSLAVSLPELAFKLATSFGGMITEKYIISPFYMWGWGRIATRNAGLFWEPGAFQAFIMVAILMLLLVLLKLKSNLKSVKKLKFQFILFSITILTTQSTTAYILFTILCIIFIKEIKALFMNDLSKNRRMLRGFIVAIVLVSGVYYIISSNNIGNKLSGLGNQYSSVEIRMSDTIKSIQLIQEGSIIGLGKTHNTTNMELEKGIRNNSNGLLNMIYTYGIFFGVIYMLFYKRGIDSFFLIKNDKRKYLLYLLFVVFHLTEGFYWLSFFLLFLFETKKCRSMARKFSGGKC